MSNIIKKVIFAIGIVLLTTVVILNVLFNSYITISEIVKIYINSILNLLMLAIIMGAIYITCRNIKIGSKKIRKKYLIFGLIIFLYVVLQIVWVNNRNATPVADQETAYELAKAMKENTLEDFIANGKTYGNLENSVYLERYSQQFTLAFVWSLIFRIFNSTNVFLIEYFNIVCNAILAITIFLICNELSTKYKVNKYLAMFLYFTFLTIPLLATFVYGDLSGLAFAMLGVYFIMKYTRENKIRYIIYSAILTSIAYMLRMNILIFIIAMIIYLFLDLISKKEVAKKILIKIISILCFIVVTIVPAQFIKNYFCNKCDLDTSKYFPVLGYVLIGLNDESGSPGEYTWSIAEIAYNDIENCEIKYRDMLKNKINYLNNNPKYTAQFFIEKNCTMWTETTLGAVRYNISESYTGIENEDDKIDNCLYKINNYVLLYQKAMILLIFICSIIVIVQNRKNLSNELILLLTIFIGGFLFHTIWEAKSRYIIPYVIVLIPIVAIEINKIKIIMPKKLQKLKKIKKYNEIMLKKSRK